jgi:phage terminase small subunit
MNPRQRRFVTEYLIDMNGARAAREAGYSAQTAAVQASRLLRNAEVRAAIEEGQRRHATRAGLSRSRLLRELTCPAFSDFGNYVDALSDADPIAALARLPEDVRRAIQDIRVVETTTGRSDDKQVRRCVRLRLHDKLSALAAIAKIQGWDRGQAGIDDVTPAEAEKRARARAELMAALQVMARKRPDDE